MKSVNVCFQVWLAIFQLLLSEETRSKYEISSYRKNILLKVSLFISVVNVQLLLHSASSVILACITVIFWLSCGSLYAETPASVLRVMRAFLSLFSHVHWTWNGSQLQLLAVA